MTAKKIPTTQRLIVALDVGTQKEALKLVRLLSPAVRVFKVGLELFCSAGPGIVKKIRDAGGKVFLDLKFLDIPNTMSSAVAAALKAKPLLLNVHALAGPSAMSKCVKTADSAKAGTKLIAVTILTSYDEAELNKINIKTPMDKTVVKLCKVSLKSGMDGVVASAMEISTLRWKFGKDFLIVTPGIRPKWAVKNDQKRIATPYKAIKDGADYIVVGRPILLADDPLKAAKMVIKEIKEALT